VLIGWLGRHSDYAGLGLGEALLFDAIKTMATARIGVHAISADAIATLSTARNYWWLVMQDEHLAVKGAMKRPSPSSAMVL
jgi:hypothetical protein